MSDSFRDRMRALAAALRAGALMPRGGRLDVMGNACDAAAREAIQAACGQVPNLKLQV